MKTFRTLILCAAVLMTGFGASAQTADKKAKTETVTFDVSMDCHSCQAKLEKNIPWEKGVKDMKVDLEKKQVTIKYDPSKTDEATLKKAIEKLDFTCTKPADKGKKQE